MTIGTADDVACADNLEHVFSDPFPGSDLDILGDDEELPEGMSERLYVGSRSEGCRIYSLDDPAAPKKLPPICAAGDRWQAEPDVEVFTRGTEDLADDRIILSLHMTDGVTPDLVGGRAEFYDVTGDTPRLLGTLWGETHSGTLVGERGWFLPSRYGKGNGEQAFASGTNDLQIYDMTPLLDVGPLDPPANCFPVYAEGVPPYNGSVPSTGPCPTLLWDGDPKELWHDSPHRLHDPATAEDDEPESTRPTAIHDTSVYLDRDVGGERRDIALVADFFGPGQDADTGGIYVVDLTGVGQANAPTVLNFWQSSARWGPWSGEPDGRGVRAYHDAEFVHGDDTLFTMVDEQATDGRACQTEVHFVRVTDDLTGAVELARWVIPPALYSDQFQAAFWPPLVQCTPHYSNTDERILYLGTHSLAGMWIVDLRRLTGHRRPIPSTTEPCLSEDVAQKACVPYLREYGPKTKADIGHYVLDAANGWTAAFYRADEADRGYVYSSGGSSPQGPPEGLNVFKCIGALTPDCKPRPGR